MSTVVPPPPPVSPGPPRAMPSPNAAQAIAGPATGLLITAVIGGFFVFLSLLFNLFGFSMGAMMAEDAQEQFMQWMSGGFGIASSVLGLLVAGFLIYASMEMKKLSQWGLAVGASVVAMLPCVSPCCLIGLPVGIWCLVVLTKPEIKTAFR
ncbi:MAG TPA: hypothetical protein VGC53_02535 [Vicinamibacteria bacterium]